MRPVSRIGRPVGQVTQPSWTDNLMVTTTFSTEGATGIYLTFEERRELIKMVWSWALDSVSDELPGTYYDDDSVNRFIQCEGL